MWGQRLWKRRANTALGNQKTISTFPQPQQQQSFGYITNVSMTPARVTFLNGLTGSGPGNYLYGARRLIGWTAGVTADLAGNAFIPTGHSITGCWDRESAESRGSRT